LVSNLRATEPDEKVVVVSNFTSVLDQVAALAAGRGWGEVLRLDGKVPVDQRQALVNRFNRADDTSFLFLLSSKAGGVGINL
jgi:DNA repair and recombination protein RAD54B